mgnify:CR=1 FL=1
MSRVGNCCGPSLDDVLASIPLSAFGCEPDAVQEDIGWERLSTINGSVEPVLLDEEGRPFRSFCALGGGTFRHYLEAQLDGDILVDVGAQAYCFAAQWSGDSARDCAVIRGGDCEVGWTHDHHLHVRKGALPKGISIAERITTRRWRLRKLSR